MQTLLEANVIQTVQNTIKINKEQQNDAKPRIRL